jgi:hypothetical protein
VDVQSENGTVEAGEFELNSGAATSRESIALRRIDPDPGFPVVGKIEVLRRKIMFVKSGLRIRLFGSLYRSIPIETVENPS